MVKKEGRPPVRRLDSREYDTNVQQIKGWTTEALDRKQWRCLAKAVMI
jgi:hypothetical protein